MPCYDPPPAWFGAAKASAEEAARLLCFMVRHSDPINWPNEVLTWYLGHRRIDLERLNDPRHHSTPETRHEYTVAADEVERVEALLVARGVRFATAALHRINRELAKFQDRARTTEERACTLFMAADVALHIKQHAQPDDIELRELDLAAYRKVPVVVTDALLPGRFVIARDQADFDFMRRSGRTPR